ncbi:ABC transporter ATP-binding protein [Aeromonas veronii]
MYSDYAIQVKSLGKCFFVYSQPIDRLKQFIFPKLGLKRKYYNEFWAVNNINLNIKRGETVAIIGRNGSGKSTLLQLICETLQPTTGSVHVNGRIAALLELGSGFNPEFTGRENVYLNASIYGLTTEQIDERFESIAQFADIGDFIEQPVKTYSSGMYVRLAFAVIAHVDADVLVIDEALAVGDAVFTQKCMRFIRAFQKKGTLLFVSHDMSSVQNLCEKALWINKGNKVSYGSSKEIAEQYLEYTLQEIYGEENRITNIKKAPLENKSIDKNATDADANNISSPVVDYKSVYTFIDNIADSGGWKSGMAEILGLTISNLSNKDEIFKGGELVKLRIQAKAHVDMDAPILGFLVKDKLGQFLFGENTLPLTDKNPCSFKKGDVFFGEFEFELPMLPNGDYAITCSVANGDLHNNIQHHHLHDAVFIKVLNSQVRWGLVGVKFRKINMDK